MTAGAGDASGDSIDPAACAVRAVAWALDKLGSDGYALRCLSFVEGAYERSNGIEVFGGSSASESARLYGVLRREGASTAGAPIGAAASVPVGAFVFFDAGGPVDGVRRDWGHVGLSVGDGTMVHAWDIIRVDPIAEVAGLVPAPGWSAPVYVGWAPPSVVLTGARRRTWS